MRKSILSKISGYSSILNSISPNSDQNIEILRISLKKQMDRKDKLQKLIDKYDQITNQQKSHIKSIKSSIIQLKDLQSKSKTKFFLNPIIYVDNHLAKQTREYLCMLLNTFYSKYQQNFECQQKTKLVSTQMNTLLQNISRNQENLLKIQKQTISVQVQLEGELLTQKTRLKDQGIRQKELQDQYKRVATICAQFEDRYKVQLAKVEKLRNQCKQLEQRISFLKNQVAEGELVKAGKQQMMARQMAYQQKFKAQINNIDESIRSQEENERLLKQKIKLKKHNIQKLRQKYAKTCLKADTLSQKLQNPSQNVPVTFDHSSLSSSQLNVSSPNISSKNHQSLISIKKYKDLFADSQNMLNNSAINFSSNHFKKSKDLIDYEVQMKIVALKNDDLIIGRNERMSVR